MNENEKLGQECAFPVDICSDGFHSVEPGMSKRFYAASMAMQGLIHRFTGMYSTEKDIQDMIKMSYKISDELLRQEKL